jgi:hypothetical protein
MRSQALVLKSVLFLIPFFSIFGPSWVPKWNQNRPKSFENPLQNYPSILNRFRHPFFDFLFDFPPPRTPKIEPKRRTVVRFHTFLVFSLRSLLGSIFDRIGLHFGWFWYPFSLHLPIQRPIKKHRFSNRFFYDFGPILASILDPQLSTIALFWVISRCLGSSPAVLGHLPRSDVIFSSLGFVFGPFLDHFRPNLVSIFCFGDHFSMILGSFVPCFFVRFFLRLSCVVVLSFCCLCVCLFVCWFVSLFVCLFVFLFVFLFVWVPSVVARTTQT